MFDFLKKFFANHPTAPKIPDYEEGLTDEQILKEYFSTPKKTKDALRKFILLIAEPLGDKESRRLARVTLASLYPGSTPSDALSDGLLGESGQKPGQWLVIQMDWKAHEELEWQVEELLHTFKIQEKWHWPDKKNRTVATGLLDFSSWLATRGHSLLHLDLGHDAYYAFMVETGKIPEVLEVGHSAGLKIQESDKFQNENDF